MMSTSCPGFSGIVQLAISFNLALNSSSVTANQGTAPLTSFAGYKRGKEVVWEWVYGSTTLREPSLIPRLLHSRTWEWDYRELMREQTKTETRNKMACALVRVTELCSKGVCRSCAMEDGETWYAFAARMCVSMIQMSRWTTTLLPQQVS